MSPIVANMIMEEIEKTALNTYLKPPSLWVRYVDDVYAIIRDVEAAISSIASACTPIAFTNKKRENDR